MHTHETIRMHISVRTSIYIMTHYVCLMFCRFEKRVMVGLPVTAHVRKFCNPTSKIVQNPMQTSNYIMESEFHFVFCFSK